MTPTIYLVGIDDLERIPEFLDLGLIVVVSPDPTTLRRWQHEQELGEAPMDRPAATTGVVVEMENLAFVEKNLGNVDRAREIWLDLLSVFRSASDWAEAARMG